MRVIFVWITFIIIFLVATVAFFGLAPVFAAILSNFNTIITAGYSGDVTSHWTTIYAVLGYAWWWLLIIIILGFLVWAYANSQRRDYESYGYEM